MLNKLPKIVPLITAVSLLAMLATPVFATGAHLWFYSMEPTIPLPDPMTWDLNYNGTDPDGWLSEGVIIMVGDWTSFSCWIGNSDSQDDSEDTTIVISVNKAAADGISSMTLNGYAVPAWDTDDNNFPMPPHAPIGSEGWYGFAEVNVGDIASGNKMALTFAAVLTGEDMEDARIHLDAYSWDDDGWPFPIFSPFSHDSTFIVPEAATILALSASMLALGAYAYKRKKQ